MAVCNEVPEKPRSIPRKAGPRLRDVAAAAGVSVSTASRALSGAGASARALASVLSASERLGYRPDPVARAMRTGATGLAGIVVPAIGNPFFAELVEELESALRSSEFEIILGNSGGSVKEESHVVQTMVDRKVDALIVAPSNYQSSTAALVRAQHRAVIIQVDSEAGNVVSDFVGVDNAAGIRTVLEHVADEGCHTVAFVSATGTTSTGDARLRAFTEAVRRLSGSRTGLPQLKALGPPVLGSYSLEFGREAVRHLIGRGLPDAIVCGDDLIALGVVRELRVRKVAVPDEVVVTGFDGILFAELSDPPLTTLRQPVGAIATETARRLKARLSGDASPPQRSEIAPVLVVRGSSRRNTTSS